MPTSDSFLGRWSRRKRAALSVPAPELPQAELPQPELPPVETLNAESDYTAFLKKGVSAAIQQQALRRAWESDATIASFRGMADYDWDFNAPAYGRLWATDDVVKLLRNVLTLPPEPKPESLVVEAGPILTVPQSVVAELSEPSVEPATESAPLPRRHGGALPS